MVNLRVDLARDLLRRLHRGQHQRATELVSRELFAQSQVLRVQLPARFSISPRNARQSVDGTQQQNSEQRISNHLKFLAV